VNVQGFYAGFAVAFARQIDLEGAKEWTYGNFKWCILSLGLVVELSPSYGMEVTHEVNAP
jgi:hypothetical protein